MVVASSLTPGSLVEEVPLTGQIEGLLATGENRGRGRRAKKGSGSDL